MTITLGWSHVRRLGLFLLVAGMISGAFYGGYYVRGTDSSVLVFETEVCGPFESPDVVMGVPIAAEGEYVTFEDGFILRRDKEHSFFKEQLGLFMLNGLEQSYALVKDTTFHPCPPENTED